MQCGSSLMRKETFMKRLCTRKLMSPSNASHDKQGGRLQSSEDTAIAQGSSQAVSILTRCSRTRRLAACHSQDMSKPWSPLKDAEG